MGFFDALTKIVNPKNILTAAGALSPLGPVAGGAVGRGVGGLLESGMDEEKDWNPLGDAFGGAALGGAGSFAAGAIGGGGGAASAAPTAVSPGASLASTATDVTPVAQSAGGAGGGFGSGIKGWWNALSGSDKASVLGQGVGAAGNIYGAYEAGRVADEEEERRRRLNKSLAPLLGDTLRGMRG